MFILDIYTAYPNLFLAALSLSTGLLLLGFTAFLVKDVFVLEKEGGLLKEKPRFFVKFLGVMFILSLAFIANNYFVYVVSVFIIATLVTELQFLEMMIALFLDRPDYIKRRLSVLNEQQEAKNNKEDLAEINKIIERQGEELRVEKAKKNQYQLFYHFEKVYRVIFGSQLKILIEAESNKGKISLMRTVLHYRAAGWTQEKYDAGEYTSFLIRMGLLTYTNEQENAYYSLTPLGKSFLSYLRAQNISLSKPF